MGEKKVDWVIDRAELPGSGWETDSMIGNAGAEYGTFWGGTVGMHSFRISKAEQVPRRINSSLPTD